MNLIEQLGGYEKAKKWPDKNNADIKWGYLGDYRRELLEYRRQHNIFEEGDLVVLPYTNYRSDVFELTGGYREVYDEKGIFYRHATPEEIAAGKRLEVNQ